MTPIRKVNILLVDDHPENLLALEAVLTSPRYHLVKARSGYEALKHLLQTDFAVILMDAHMPGLSGFETAKLIKQRENVRHIPIIFLTALNKTPQQIAQGYFAGAIDYIVTPYDPDILRSKVAAFIDLYNIGEQIKRQTELLRLTEQKMAFELRRASQRYRKLAEAMPLVVWTARPDGAIDYFNQRWFRYTGLTFEQSEGWRWTEALHPEDLQKCVHQLSESVRIGGGCDLSGRLRRHDGSYRRHLIQTVPERDLGGEIIAWIGTAMDIHDQSEKDEPGEMRMKASA